MSNMNPWCHGVTIVTRNGVSGRHPLIEILSAWHGHELISIPRAWHARVRPFRSDSNARSCQSARSSCRTRIPTRSSGSALDSAVFERRTRYCNGLGRLARIGCSRPAALLNLMPIFFRFRVLESEPPTSSRIGWLGIFCECRAKFGSFVSLLALESGG